MKRSDFLKIAGIGTGTVAMTPFAALKAKSLKPEHMTPMIVRKGDGKKVDVLGDKMTFKLTGKDTGGLFTLIEENNAPGVGIPPHVHDNEDEIFRVIEGELEVTVGGDTTILKAGDTAFAPRGVPHTWRVVGNGPVKVDLSIFPAGLEHMFEELGALPAGPTDMEKVVEICGRYNVRFV
ncbi:cupin domain-containing protein [soil metagenome]